MIAFRRRPAPPPVAAGRSHLSGAAAGEAGESFSLAVLNLGGRDPEQHFPAGAGQPEAPGHGHAPINHHAYAACTGGSFHARADKALATGRPILLLVRRDLGAALSALRRIQRTGRPVAIAFKEAGTSQLAERLTLGRDLRRLRALVETADGCLASSPWLTDFFVALRIKPAPDALLADHDGTVMFIPTPYPVDDPRWNFSVPPAQRRGVFIGTREFDVPSRQHLRAIVAARQIHAETDENITVINPGGRRGARALAALGFSTRADAALRLVSGPVPYVEYLRLIARHRLVFQLDRSGVPGQVAGDALLCRLPCVGGDGAIERLAFPGLCGTERDDAGLAATAIALLREPARYEHAWRDGQTRALESLSFRAVAEQLAAYYWTLKAHAAYRAG